MAAVVAAPILKPCPAYWCWGNPIALRMWRISSTKRAFVTGLLDESRKKAPGWVPRSSMYNVVEDGPNTAEFFASGTNQYV